MDETSKDLATAHDMHTKITALIESPAAYQSLVSLTGLSKEEAATEGGKLALRLFLATEIVLHMLRDTPETVLVHFTGITTVAMQHVICHLLSVEAHSQDHFLLAAQAAELLRAQADGLLTPITAGAGDAVAQPLH